MGRTNLVTWRSIISTEMAEHGESWGDIIHVAVAVNESAYTEQNISPDGWMDQKFDNGFGGAEGCYFTVWTAKRVYFPTEYDGAEWVRSVPRNPCDEATKHV